MNALVKKVISFCIHFVVEKSKIFLQKLDLHLLNNLVIIRLVKIIVLIFISMFALSSPNGIPPKKNLKLLNFFFLLHFNSEGRKIITNKKIYGRRKTYR